MILKPIELTTIWEVRREKIQREGWLVRWDGHYLEHPTPPPLPPLLKPKELFLEGEEEED